MSAAPESNAEIIARHRAEAERRQAAIDAAWAEVIAATADSDPIHPWNHRERSAWVKRHRPELDAARDRHLERDA
jgi:hypothetical protein